jgi:glucose/arabinose dehydrogenase
MSPGKSEFKPGQVMRTSHILFATMLLALFCGSLRSQPAIGLEPFATGLANPSDIKNAGDSRLFVVEQEGYIVILDSTGLMNNRPFLDIRDRVNSAGTEQGLIGLAFHPGYSGNGFFYVNYTGPGDSTHISRFQVSAADPDSAEANTELNLLTIYQPYTNHNGGELQFGPDGYLYIGLGDGGSAGDPGNRAQDLSELLGKMLRIDINGGTPYAIPPDNPFVNQFPAREEIWALGLRNPWRFSFDRTAGDLWIADVGQGSFEEVDFQPASAAGGENYGWRCYEGFDNYDTAGCLPTADFTFPVYVYPHDASPCWSVTGGYVYRGTRYPGFQGRYFFAEYCKDSVWTLSGNSGTWSVSLRGYFPGNNFSTFGENYLGELFIAGHSSGNVYRVTDTGPSGLEGTTGQPAITVAPNPCSDRLRISRASGHSGSIIARISDLSGRVLLSCRLSETDHWIETGSLARGTYLLSLYDPKGKEAVRTCKIVKQ